MAIDRNVTININDISPSANTAYVDAGKENKVYNKAQVNELVEDLREGTLGSILPSQTLDELNALPDGNYYAAEAGTYAFGVTVPNGWQYRFNKSGTTWKVLTKVEIPKIKKSSKVSENDINAVESGAVFAELKPIKQMLGNVITETEGENQFTTSENAVTSSVGTVHGYSFPIGVISKPFSNVTVYFAQNTTAPVSEIEIRFFKINSTGEFILKKRLAFVPDLAVQTSVKIAFNTIINSTDKLWCQILMNNPFAIKRVSPAIIFTPANGYDAPKATTINNLDGTTFSTSQSAVDVLLMFNSVENSVSDIDFTDYGKSKVKSIIAEGTQSDLIEIPMIWNCVGHSIWAQDQVLYNNSHDIANGIQTWIRTFFKFTGYNKWCYSGRSLGAISTTDESSITHYFSTWLSNPSYKYFWTYDSITNDFKRNIPLGNISDYNNNTGALTYYGALRLLVDKINELSPNAIVICANAMERNNGGYTTTSVNTVGCRLIDYELALMDIAVLNGWLFVDQKRQSGIYEENLSKTTRDGLHPNDFGYSICYKPWYDIFSKMKTLI